MKTKNKKNENKDVELSNEELDHVAGGVEAGTVDWETVYGISFTSKTFKKPVLHTSLRRKK